MKAVWYGRNGAARDVLQYGEMTDPTPGPGEVRVKLAFSGVNPSDWKTRSGSRAMGFARVIPHSDGAGIIDSVGPGVDPRRIGERVWIWNGQWKRPFGTAAELIALASEQAVRLPENVSLEVGATLGIPALTAYRAATTDGSVASADVLVSGGAGAVGFYAIQMARLLGARRVLATVSSEEKAALARAAGADATINYRTQDVAERVRAETRGRGVDRVIEVDLAGNASLLPKVAAPDSLCAAYGSNAREIQLAFGPLLQCGVAIRFFVVYELAASVRAEAIATLTRWLERGQLQHRIDSILPLAQTATAHERLEQGLATGKILLAL